MPSPNHRGPALHRVTVFTGSKPGNNPQYVEAVQTFARALAAHNVDVVFGGGNVGLMGVLADTALAAGAQVHGVMPESMQAAETPHPNLTQLDIVADLHARKQRMAELGDAFVALPGGIGTLEELFEIWTWQQLGIHTKPVALYNPMGFWDPLLAMVDHMAVQGFVRRSFTQALIVEDNASALIEKLLHWRHSHTSYHPGGSPRHLR